MVYRFIIFGKRFLHVTITLFLTIINNQKGLSVVSNILNTDHKHTFDTFRLGEFRLSLK